MRKLFICFVSVFVVSLGGNELWSAEIERFKNNATDRSARAVKTLSADNKDSGHYRLDREAGEVSFGDGVRGRIPPSGKNGVKANYRHGAGEKGNVSSGGQKTKGVKRIKTLRHTAQTLRTLAAEKIPGGLNREQRREARKFSNWLNGAEKKVKALAIRWEKRAKNVPLNSEKMREINSSFNLQLLQLQRDMQKESRQFTIISNIMKNRHDTAKASINNMR